MVITGINSAGCFCADMGDVVMSGVDTDIAIDFTLYFNGVEQSSWSERYTPDASGVVKLRELGNIAMDYFLPMGMNINFNTVDSIEFDYNVVIAAIIKTASGAQLERFEQKFYYASQKIGITNNEYRFFYNRYSKRLIHPDQFVPVGYNLDEQCLKVGVVFYANGLAEYRVLNYGDEVNQSMHRLRNLSPKVIAQKVSAEYGSVITVADIIYYEASLYYQNKLKDKIRFDLDHKYYKQLTHLIFYNVFGYPETIYMTGKDEKSAQMEGAYALINGEYTKIDTKLNETHTLNSGYITEASYNSIKDLVKSKEVYLYKGTQMQKIAITDVDLSGETPKSSPLNVKITYRLANDKDVAFVRPGITRNRVFDETFDHTFA